MAKRRPAFESLEARLCMTAPLPQTTFPLPNAGNWTPTVYRSSPLFADIFNRGTDDFIAVASGAELVAYRENPDGSASAEVTYKVPGGLADLKATPVVVTDPRTGRKDIFAAMGRDETTNNPALEDGRVFGWDAQTGQLLPGWANGVSTGRNPTNYSGAYGPIASGQLEGNGMPDIVVSSFSHNVTAFRLDGSVLWQWANDDTVVSGVAIGDIDRGGTPSVIVGGDSSPSVFYGSGGWVNALSNTGALKWRHFIPGEVTWSSPTLADLNNNGYLDIVIGTGLNYDTVGLAGSRALGNYIYALDPFGNILPGWPYHTTNDDSQPRQVLGSLAVADIQGTGRLDVVAIDRGGYVHVVGPAGRDLPGWAGGREIAPPSVQPLIPGTFASPIVADVFGTGQPDIVASAGPYVVAFDPYGQETILFQTKVGAPGNIPEGIDAAAAVGNFGPYKGGLGGLTLAVVSYNPGTAAQPLNRPDIVTMLSLAPSTLTPPWPLQRRDAAGVPVERSTSFDTNYVNSVFIAALAYVPNTGPIAPFYNQMIAELNNNTINLLGVALVVNSSPPARQAEIQRLYQSFLGRAADPFGLAAYTDFLATNTDRQLEITLASSAEFANRAGNNPSREVVQLYQAILGRAPSQAELNGLLARNLSPGAIATQLVNSIEGIAVQFYNYDAVAEGPAQVPNSPPDAVAAYIHDGHRGGREEVMDANIIASAGNYAANNFEAGYVRDLYRDVLKRDASSAEVAAWVFRLDAGSTDNFQIATRLLDSVEARDIYVNQEFLALLGRPADPVALSVFQGYANRESVVLAILASPEYFARNGGNVSSYVTAVYRDLAGFPVDAGTNASWTARINAGLPRIGVAQAIIYGSPLYFNGLTVAELQQYLPNEALGVLRSGNLPPTAAGQPINPDPNLIAFYQGLIGQGYSDEQVIACMLTSNIYDSRVTYDKRILRSPGIRD